MSWPVLLDLFAGSGGAAAGYAGSGFDVVGIDHVAQPNYPFTFHRLDWREGLARFGEQADAIHASPPCQAYSRSTAWRGDRSSHPDLIAEVRDALALTGLPYVIENVQEARFLLRAPIMLCGSMFGLPIRRHRWFEISGHPLLLVSECRHRPDDFSHDHGAKQSESAYRDALGCGWMTCREARQAVPPAYTRFLGAHLLETLTLARTQETRR